MISCIKFKEIIHPLLMKVLSAKTTGPLTVFGELPKNETCLIVANHVCIEDIPTLAQAVKEHFCLLVSDEDKYTIDGLGLTLNGVQWVHRTDKKSRSMAAKEIVRILKSGKSFAMYPESTWNLSPNLLMLPMNYGCIKIALEAHVPIVPVVSSFYPNARFTIIGDKFYPTEDLKCSIAELRDRMATMIFQEIEMQYQSSGVTHESRAALDGQYWDNHVDALYEKYDRARRDKNGIRNFESQFIYTPKTNDHSFFQEFNSLSWMDVNGKQMVKRISSENGGYQDGENQNFFGYGYNEAKYKL